MAIGSFSIAGLSAPLRIYDNYAFSSSLSVGGFGSGSWAKVVNVGVTLVGLQHTYPADLDFLLLGPRGTNLEFWSDVGGGFDISGNFAISDFGERSLPDYHIYGDGTYRPADYELLETYGYWGGGANPPPVNLIINHPGPNGTASFASAFGGVSLKDSTTWTLYIRDDIAGGDVGSLQNWGLNITYNVIVKPDDFNGNGRSDVLLQNSDGTPMIWLMPAIWLMNGSNVPFAGAAGPFNPGPSWQIKGTGDFNFDAMSDILWQNSDGTPAIWLMDGAYAVSRSAVGPFNPGPSWEIKGTGDFNGDGKSDILWQGADGSPAIWLMDGMKFIAGGAAGAFNPGPSWEI